MKIATLVIACTGNIEPIRKTILSVVDFKDRLSLIIKSTSEAYRDALEVAREFPSLDIKVVGGSDSGIYDAWYQSSKIVTTEFILFAGVGDIFNHSGLDKILSVALKLTGLPVAVIYGGLQLVSPAGKVLEIHNKSIFQHITTWSGVRRSCPVTPEALINTKDAINILPKIKHLSIAGDVWLFILLYRDKNFFHINETIVNMEDGGRSTWPSNAMVVYNETLALSAYLEENIPIVVKFKFYLICITRFYISKFFGNTNSNIFFDFVRTKFGRKKRYSVK